MSDRVSGLGIGDLGERAPMDYATFVRKLPKVDLHCHLAGTIQPATIVELAGKRGVELASTRPTAVYEFKDFVHFLKVLDLIGLCLIEEEDFARVAYEAIESGTKAGNLRYGEFFVSPTDYYPSGVSYKTVIDGVIKGFRDAETDFGVAGRVIVAINREQTASQACDLVRTVADYRCDEVIGIGLDRSEHLGPPEQFKEAFTLARSFSLERTAHVCEDNQTLDQAPPSNVVCCLDDLGCSRLDHGYNVMSDGAVVDRCRRENVPFTVCSHTCTTERQAARVEHVRAMYQAGLNLVFGDDDPPMFGTDIGRTYEVIGSGLGLSPRELGAACLNGVAASWLDSSGKKRLAEEFTVGIDSLLAELAGASGMA